MLESAWSDWTSWWATVPPEFAFLLALPFAVAALGLVAGCARRHLGRPGSVGR